MTTNSDHDHAENDDETQDSRALLEEALDGWLDKDTLSVLLRETLAITKSARGWCPNCKKAVQVEIPDSRAVVSSIAELLTQAKGRPGQESEDGQQTVVNIRYVVGKYHDGEVLEDSSTGLLEFPDGTFARRTSATNGATD